MAVDAIDEAPDLAVPFDLAPFDDAPLRTERLVLRPLTAGDRDDIWLYQRLPEVLRYIPWPERSLVDAHEHTMRRVAMRRLADDGDAVFFAMVHTGRVIGDLMVRVSSAGNAELELGWVVHPDFQGRGLAAEGAAEVLRFAFTSLRAHRVIARLDARNEASARLCERLGMRREALRREDEWDDGWRDSLHYAVLRREWVVDGGD